MSNPNVLSYNPPLRGETVLDRSMIWFKAHERRALLVAVTLQFVVLLSMIAIHAATLLFGETVRVRVVPVDPRDLFRGDYVVLSYEFSQIPPEGIEGLSRNRPSDNLRDQQGRTVYVSLIPEGDGKHLKAGTMSIHKPAEGPFLRGRLAGWNQIAYGIEAFYLQEGQGLEYEKAVQSRQLSAELAVTSGGKAALRSLHIADSSAPPAGSNAGE